MSPSLRTCIVYCTVVSAGVGACAGNDCFKKGEFQNAIIYYSRAVAVEPNDARLYSNRSAAFCVLKMLGRALKDALVCVHPVRVDFVNFRVTAYCTSSGLYALQTAILLKPRWAKGYFRAGAAFFFLGQLQEALDMVSCTLHFYALGEM